MFATRVHVTRKIYHYHVFAAEKGDGLCWFIRVYLEKNIALEFELGTFVDEHPDPKKPRSLKNVTLTLSYSESEDAKP
jgi:hypothetical protein